jgi:hypothetical protein
MNELQSVAMNEGVQQIGRSRAIGVSTVCKYLKRAEAATLIGRCRKVGIDARIEATLFLRTAASAKVQTTAAHGGILPRSMSSCGNTVISFCNCVGKNTGRRIGMALLFPLLRVVPALALEAQRGAAAGAQSGRESVR